MEQKAAEELNGIESQELGAAVVGVVFPFEADEAVFERAQAVVGNGDAVSVAGQILQHTAWPAEGWFGVNDPFDGGRRLAESVEGGWFRQSFEFAVEVESAFAKGPAQGVQKQFAEAMTEQMYGQEEEDFRPRIQREPSVEIPPPGTTQCRCGCKCRF